LHEQREEIYPPMMRRGEQLMASLRSCAQDAGVPMLVEGTGAVFQTYLTEATAVRDYRDFAATDRAAMGRLHQRLLDRGVSIVPRGLWFLSTEHTEAHLAETIEAVEASLRQLDDAGTSRDRKSTRLNSSHVSISYAVFCLKRKSSWRQRRVRSC